MITFYFFRFILAKIYLKISKRFDSLLKRNLILSLKTYLIMKKYLVTWVSPSGNLEKRICENIIVLGMLLNDVVRTLQTYEFSISNFTIKSL